MHIYPEKILEEIGNPQFFSLRKQIERGLRHRRPADYTPTTLETRPPFPKWSYSERLRTFELGPGSWELFRATGGSRRPRYHQNACKIRPRAGCTFCPHSSWRPCTTGQSKIRHEGVVELHHLLLYLVGASKVRKLRHFPVGCEQTVVPLDVKVHDVL